MNYSGIGGQAVLEGVMMKNGDDYAVAVRKPDGEIEVKKDQYKGFSSKHHFCSLPFIRGIFNLIDSMILGVGTLNYSAEFYDDEDGKKEQDPKKKKVSDNLLMGATVALSFVLAIVIFMVIPVFLSNLLSPVISSVTVISLIEGLFRLAILIAYIGGISLMSDIRRVYMYHGAEHKCINCVEHGLPLTVENVAKSSRQHKRCGTSFMLIVVVISVVLFTFIHVENIWLRILSRIILIPIVASLAYEFLRLSGRSDNKIVNALSKPGLWLQAMTTREPDPDMIKVGIASVEAVFDWRAWQAENFGTAPGTESGE